MGEYLEFDPKPAELVYTFGGWDPVWDLRPGDVLTVSTEDCFGGVVRDTTDLPSRVCDFPYLNPVTGPFHVEGAQPGDTLAVHFLDITPTRDWGVSATFPHFGALTSTGKTATLQPALEERVWRYDVDVAAGLVRYHAHSSDLTIELPLAPMHGTVGVAPPGMQAISTITSDAHGGNLDTPEICAGATLYLPVFVPGALLALGDGHALQGAGEISGAAVETAMRTTLTVEVLKGVTIAGPRLETDTTLMSIGCARPLEDAVRASQTDMVRWVADLTGLDVLDAYQLVAQAGTATVGNVCDPNYTMLAGFPKHLLGATAVYGGVHDRLRAIPPSPDPAGVR